LSGGNSGHVFGRIAVAHWRGFEQGIACKFYMQLCLGGGF
jgi:hypothetical protein